MALRIWASPYIDLYALLRPILFLLSPETAHQLTIKALQSKLGPRETLYEYDPILKTNLFGFDFSNPVGLSAGFDNKAEAIEGILNLGFGFAEFGTVTPLPYAENISPRIFRIPEASAIIKLCGLDGSGLEYFARNIQTWRSNPDRTIRPVIASLGANKESTDAIKDRITCLKRIYPYTDLVTIGLSIPTDKGLHELLPATAISSLLQSFTKARDEIAPGMPVLVKMPYDITEEQQAETAAIIMKHDVQGIIIGGASSARPSNVPRNMVDKPGGLSGPPIFGPSTRVLSNIYKLTGGKIPLIGGGGVGSGADAYEKIRSGASLVQLYSAMVFKGPGLIPHINSELADLLKRDGFSSVSEAVGANHK